MADTVEAQCREALTAEAFTASWEKGVALDANAAAEWALQLLGRSGVAPVAACVTRRTPAPFPNRFHSGHLDPSPPRPPIPKPQEPCGIPRSPLTDSNRRPPSLPWRCSTD